MLAECIPSDTRRTSSLPSATLKTLGKQGVLPSVKKTLGKEVVCRVLKNTRQRYKIFFLEKKEKKKMKKKLCRVPHLEHSVNKKKFLT